MKESTTCAATDRNMTVELHTNDIYIYIYIYIYRKHMENIVLGINTCYENLDSIFKQHLSKILQLILKVTD